MLLREARGGEECDRPIEATVENKLVGSGRIIYELCAAAAQAHSQVPEPAPNPDLIQA